MPRTAQLYLKTEKGVSGPFAAGRLHEMVREGAISSRSLVSPDGRRWLSAARIKGLFVNKSAPAKTTPASTSPVLLSTTSVRPELRRLFHMVESHARSLIVGFNVAVSATILATLFLSFFFFYGSAFLVFPEASLWLLTATAFPPSLLLAAAAGHRAGVYALRRLCGLSESERRCLALHLPWSRAPRSWPRFLLNWLYGGDWLVDSSENEILPYVRAFVSGPRPKSLVDELDHWSQLMQDAVCRNAQEMEVGHSVRELAFLDALPRWTRDIDPGATLESLQGELGHVAREWAVSLLKRAATRVPAFRDVDPAGDLSDVHFEFYYCTVDEEREGLVVLLRMRAPVSDSQVRTVAPAEVAA